MVRKRRQWYPGATYHIFSRGIRKLPIFYDDEDRKVYLEQMLKVRERYPFKLHCYCLMTNHIHLLLETDQVPPSDIIRLLHTRYAIYFNHRHQLSGHVFQGRYTAKIIDSLTYFLEASRYIHRNPIEAGMAEKAQDLLWSSYIAYIESSVLPFITTEKTLSYFESPSAKNYQLFVENERTDE
ncbi:hypothetical protein PB1_08932 [Bacillus methanolicus PB1]|uniref:Transposase IS200-like domain-containing protein n=1 Tax=Bacillus methanolicus PB1 TaxID=997296 RepID=I3E1V1_BACMT|nr:transposase [Bacillus methanolicus]EIJ80472.1 hypothetical protein PB1_08932 [Bacillus methanolicus PB1]